MATRTVVCPECNEPLAIGRLSCASCGSLLASVAGAPRRTRPLRTVVLEEPTWLAEDSDLGWLADHEAAPPDVLADPEDARPDLDALLAPGHASARSRHAGDSADREPEPELEPAGPEGSEPPPAAGPTPGSSSEWVGVPGPELTAAPVADPQGSNPEPELEAEPASEPVAVLEAEPGAHVDAPPETAEAEPGTAVDAPLDPVARSWPEAAGDRWPEPPAEPATSGGPPEPADPWTAAGPGSVAAPEPAPDGRTEPVPDERTEPVPDPDSSPDVEPAAPLREPAHADPMADEPPPATAPGVDDAAGAPADLDDAAEPAPPDVIPARSHPGRWEPVGSAVGGPALRPALAGRTRLDLTAEPSATQAVTRRPEPVARPLPGAWLPPALDPPPPPATSYAPPVESSRGIRLRAGEAPLLADLPFDAPTDVGGWLVVLGGAIATLGFLLPWANAMPFTTDSGYLGRWGLATASHTLVFLASAVLLGFATVPNRVPAWLRGGVAPLVLGGLLLGLVWPHVLGGYGSHIGSLAVALAAALLVIGGTLTVRRRDQGDVTAAG